PVPPLSRALDLTYYYFFFSSRRRHTRFSRDWSSDVCSSDLFRTESSRCSPAHRECTSGESDRLLPAPRPPGNGCGHPPSRPIHPESIGCTPFRPFAASFRHQPGQDRNPKDDTQELPGSVHHGDGK